MFLNRVGFWLAWGLAGLALVFLGSGAGAEILGDYVTYQACSDCHQEVAEAWKKTPHAHAWEILKKQGDEKQSVPGCIKCHVVAYEKDGGFIDMDLTPEFVNVQCESCHGPGARHIGTGGEGHIVARPDEASCRACHTEGQDKNFDYTRKSKLVHPKP